MAPVPLRCATATFIIDLCHPKHRHNPTSVLSDSPGSPDPTPMNFFLKVISGFTCYEDTLIKSNKGSDSKFLTADSFQVPLYFLPQAQVLPPLVPARSTNHVSTSCSRNTHSSPSLIGHITSNQSPFPAFSSYFWTSLRIHSALPRKCVIQIINPS